MIAIARCLIIFQLIVILSQEALAQPALTDTTKALKICEPSMSRALFHNYIDKEQRNILSSDGINDIYFTPTANEEINFILTQSLTGKVDLFQCKIEKDSSLTSQGKVRYLRGMENLLKFFYKNQHIKKINPVLLTDIINAFENCVQADKSGRSIEYIITRLPYAVGHSVIKADKVTFANNAGYKGAQEIVILKYCALHPEQTFQTLKENPDMPFADSMVRLVAQKYPRQLYDFAQANNKLGHLIRNINDDVFIKSVVRMAKSKSGQQYFPFLDNIVKGKMTFEEIDSIKNDSVQYYKLLVKTQMEYAKRALQKDTAIEFKALTARLEQKANEEFVNTINGLHNEDAPIRFQCIQPLNAEELYYLAVSSDGSIYTSSFVKGVYPLMMKKINNRGDSLLMLLNFDKYRKFIKMAAAYNTLSNFLSSFPKSTKADEPDDAVTLMKAFVGGLEKFGLEDGVDVADSYASVAETIKPVANEMLKNVQVNYQLNVTTNNRRGMVIYNILNKLFLSADSSNKIDLTKELSIPPVYEVTYKSLTNEDGRAIMQVFFYDDKKVQNIFRGFINMFSNANWKIVGNDQWVCITSAKGKPVSIYANRAYTEEGGGKDEMAQKALGAYLEKNNLHPSITIHRGHSYTAPYTIAQMVPTSMIVFLGSCGGYQIIHDALEKAPDAHIIATKQIADAPVNRPFFQLLTEKVRNGNNINWIPFWKELDKIVTAKIFEDYIPPYKNLGAIFIKAYKLAMTEKEKNY